MLGLVELWLSWGFDNINNKDNKININNSSSLKKFELNFIGNNLTQYEQLQKDEPQQQYH